jgi:hypothetical protein
MNELLRQLQDLEAKLAEGFEHGSKKYHEDILISTRQYIWDLEKFLDK